MTAHEKETELLRISAAEREERFEALDAFFSKLEGLSDQSRMIAALEAVTEVIATSIARKDDARSAVEFARNQLHRGIEKVYSDHDGAYPPRSRKGRLGKH